MKRIWFGIALLMLIGSCAKVPITGRRQLNMLPESQLMDMSLTNYKTFLSENKVAATTKANTQMVKSVGKKISIAVEKFLNKEGQSKRIKGYIWEFNLVEENTVNAWCMPGGKIAVYTGILPITKDDTGLAVVLGHEIAHALAEHGHQRMNEGLAAKVGIGAIGIGLGFSDVTDGQTNQIILAASGALVTYGITLPNSREHEHEADKIGLKLMARAGYNPEEAVPFWQRMGAVSKGKHVVHHRF